MEQKENLDQVIAHQVEEVIKDLAENRMIPAKWRALYRATLTRSKGWTQEAQLPAEARAPLCALMELAFDQGYIQKVFKRARAAILAHTRVTDEPTAATTQICHEIESWEMNTSLLPARLVPGDVNETPKLMYYEFESRQRMLLAPLRERQDSSLRKETRLARQTARASI